MPSLCQSGFTSYNQLSSLWGDNDLMRFTGDPHLIRIALAAVILLLIPNSAMPGAVEPPIVVAERLIDLEQTSGLGLETIDGTHQLLYRATKETHKFCHHANLVVFNQRLYLMWSNGLVHEDSPWQRILMAWSDDGQTWNSPQWLTGEKQEICVAAGFHVHDDTLVAYFTVTGGSNFHPDTALYAIRSRDGLRWSDRQRITGGFFIEGPRALAKGRLLLAGEHVDPARTEKRMKVLVSDDPSGLGDWREVDITPAEVSVFGYTEPALFLSQKGKRATLLLRNYSGSLYASNSRDNGETWSTPEITAYPDSTARIAAGNLPNGTAYLVNNPSATQFDRSHLVLGMSRDGVHFDRAALVRSEPTKMRFEGKSKLDGWQYPHCLSWRRHFYIAYTINKEDVGITRIPLRRLK